MNPKKTIRPEHKKQHAKNTIRSIKRHWQLYLIVALPLVYLIVFKYMPIIGSHSGITISKEVSGTARL